MRAGAVRGNHLGIQWRERLALALRQLAVLVRIDFASRRILRGNGLLHLVVVPLAQLAVYAWVFAGIFKARVPGLDSYGYVAFLALGMWPWIAFSEGASRGATALIDNSGLCNKSRMSPFLLILSRVLTSFAVHGIGLLVVLVALLLFGPSLEWSGLGAYLLGWLALMPAGLALAMFAALLILFVRDFQQLLPLLLTVGLFASPILYTSAMQPEAVRALAWLNPAGQAISFGRDAMFGPLSWHFLAESLAGSAVLLVLTGWMYRRLRPVIVDYL